MSFESQHLFSNPPRPHPLPQFEDPVIGLIFVDVPKALWNRDFAEEHEVSEVLASQNGDFNGNDSKCHSTNTSKMHQHYIKDRSKIAKGA